MSPPNSPKSKRALQPMQTLPIAVEEGVIMTDMSLRPVAVDRGATAILADIYRREGSTESVSSLPTILLKALRENGLEHLAGFRIRLLGERQTYDCRAFFLESCAHPITRPLISLHFHRIQSPVDVIRKASLECGLTPREEDVLAGLSDGLTTKELADRLDISPHTVKAFLRLIMIKMGVTTRAAVVGRLLNEGSAKTNQGSRYPARVQAAGAETSSSQDQRPAEPRRSPKRGVNRASQKFTSA
jgi:DNA-binding CsgD family transcriptional regulator